MAQGTTHMLLLAHRMRPVLKALAAHGIPRREIEVKVVKPCDVYYGFRHLHAVVWLRESGFDGMFLHGYRRIRGKHGLKPVKENGGWGFESARSAVDRIIAKLKS